MGKMIFRSLTCICFLFTGLYSKAQPGKDGTRTISVSTIVNEFTALTVNAGAGATSLTVTSSSLNANGRFSASLAQGDLVLIIQMQGASMNATPSGMFSLPNSNSWGSVTNYNNCGNYEFAQVASVPNATTINLTCGLEYSYTAAGHVQVIRVPRYTTLTVNNTLTTEVWNGTTGGVLAVEVQTSTTIGASGTINATATGFRGGAVTENNSVYGGTAWGSSSDAEGNEKGEGIVGFTTEYTPLNARYCRGAPANGGGGGNGHNCGGGGGSNAGNLTNYTGNGNPDVSNAAWINIWNLEAAGFATSTSSGGGRGGYSFSNSNQNAASVPPNDPAWGGDNHRPNGGLGGWPLDYTTGKIFMGGGGGAGDQNDGDGGPGGRGGGIVFILSYGTVSGGGNIQSNGQAGTSANPASPPATGYAGIDGAGGGGGGGTVIINSNGAISGITINANGGVGGNQNFANGIFASPVYNPAYGPGGGGGGGYIAISNGTITRNTNGGNNGTTNSSGLTEFPPDGATRGGAGLPTETFNNYYFTLTNDTICAGNTATLTAVVTGTIPAGVTMHWYATQFSATPLGTGTSFTTPVLSATTTYYVGFCPGAYRLPVTVVVSPALTVNTTGLNIIDETCTGNDGSISGITVSGGTGTLTYTWNGNASPGTDLTGATAGNYTLVATDALGCTASSGPHTIGSSGGPVINTTGMVISNSTCGNSNGSISGITVSGGTGTLSYNWNGNASAGPDLSNQPAGSYTLQVTDATGCSSNAGPFSIGNNGGVTINSTSVVITDATCGNTNGSITGITASSPAGGLTYSWNGNPGASADLTNTGSGSYSLLVTDGAGCTATAGPYTINSLGGATINTSGINITHTSCGENNGSISGITVSGGTGTLTYEWNGNPSANQDLDSASSGSYTLTVTDTNGCIASAGPFTLNPSSGVTVSATGSDVSCNGLADGSATASATGNGSVNYQWTAGPSGATYNNLTAGTYTVIVTDSTNCTDTATITISEPAAINPSITGTSPICQGDTITLTANGGGTYLWNTNETTSSISVGPNVTTTYDVDVMVAGCIENTTFTVTVNNNPTAVISGNTTACDGQSITLTASGGTSYVWSDGSTGNTLTYTPTAPGDVFVTATNNCGSDDDTVSVNISSGPTVSAGPDQTIGLGNSVVLTATGASSYTWDPATGLSCTGCTSTTASPQSTTTYIVTGTDNNGCTSTDTVTVIVDASFVIFVPDIFSPDGNGSNDVLYVRGSGVEELNFKLYDRWGQKVFETTDLNIGWDGVFNGKALDTGVFVYALEGKYLSGDSFSQKGNITLKR